MRRLNSVTLFAAAAEIYRKRMLRSVPICYSSHRSFSAASGFAMRRLNSATLFPAAAAAAEIYRKRLLRSVPICDSSRRYLSAAAGFCKTYEKKRLPAELSALEHVAELTCESAALGGICHVYLIGTEHYTRESCEEVKAMIEFVKPEAVFVELCPNRAHLLKPENPLGGEFRVAYQEGIKHGARKIRLGDRPSHITRGRFPIMAHFWERLVSPLKIIPMIIKLIRHDDGIKRILKLNYIDLANDEIKRILQLKVVKLECDEMHRVLPSRHETLINERDQYMSAKLLELAQQYNSVVAVVGKAHVRGIQKYWKQPIDVNQLLHAPTRTKMVTRIRHVLLSRILKDRWR